MAEAERTIPRPSLEDEEQRPQRAKLQVQQAPDELLVQETLKGSAEAFEALYARYMKRVYSFVYKRLHNTADTEETVQEVFLAVFSSLDSFRGEAAFAAWVLGIARRTVANRFKRKRHPTVPLALDEEFGSVDPLLHSTAAAATPLDDYEARERLERLRLVAREGLSAEQRELFVLHHLEHRSISDIASDLEKSEDAVKSHLYRARKVLLAG